MTIIDEASKQYSNRDILVRIKPGYDITDNLSLVSGTTYDMTFDYKPVLIEEDGVSRSFTWVESTSILTVTLIATPSETNPVIAYFYIFATNSQTKYLDETDPTGSITTVAEWLPRISTSPATTSSIGDILEVRIYSSSTGISFTNIDRHYDQYFKRNDDAENIQISFINKEIFVWFGFNSEFELAFYGTIVKATLNNNTFNISLKDNFRKLRKQCLFNDSYEENYINDSIYPETQRNMIAKPIPFVYGSSKPNAITNIIGGRNLETVDENPSGWFPKATLVDSDYSDLSGSGKNKTLILGRTTGVLDSDNVNFTFSLGGVSDTVTFTGSSGSTTHRVIHLQAVDIHRVSVFCYLKITWSTTGVIHQTITSVNYTTANITITNSYPTETVTAVVREKPYAIAGNIEIVPGSSFLTPILLSTASITSTLTTGGNYLHKFTRGAGTSGLRPDKPHYFTLFEATTPTLEVVAEDLLQKSGYSNTSITSSNIQPEFMQLPFGKETDFKTYDEYIALLLAPKLKFLQISKTDSLDIDLGDIYSTIDSLNPPSTIYEIDESEILSDSLTSSIDYQDIINQLEFKHPEAENLTFQSNVNIDYISERVFRKHNLENKASIQNTGTRKTGEVKIDKYWQIAQQPKIIYQMDLTVKWYSLAPGEYIKVTSSRLPTSYKDGSNWVLLLVTDVTKSISKVTVKARTVEYVS